MAHYKILGRDPYWMNFYGLMLLTAIEVGAVEDRHDFDC